MTNKTFFTRLTIGIALFFGIVFGAQAINITVPSSPSAGYWLISTTTGAYISTTTSPIMVGYVNATSTTATSTFANGLNTTGGCLAQNGTCLTSSLIGGTGTTNTIPKFTAAGTIGDSSITDDGSMVTVQGAASIIPARDISPLYLELYNDNLASLTGISIYGESSITHPLVGIDVNIVNTSILEYNIGVRSTITAATGGGGIAASFYGNATNANAVYYGTSIGVPIFSGVQTSNSNILLGTLPASYTGNVIDLTMGANPSNAKFLSFSQSGERFFVDGYGTLGFYGGFVNGSGSVGIQENVCLYSEDFSNAAWVKTGVIVTADTVINPFFQTSNADTLTTNTMGSNTVVQTFAGTTASKTFTASFWVNKAGQNWTATLGSGNEAGTSVTLTTTNNTWKYITITSTFTSGSTGSPKLTFNKIGTGYIIKLWGVNVSETAYPVTYSPTLGITVTNKIGTFSRNNLLLWSPDATSTAKFRLGGNQGSVNLFQTETNTETVTDVISSGFNWGLGTTSPYAKLSVVGETVSSYFTATSTTATSSFAGGVYIYSPTATSTPYIYSKGTGFGGRMILEDEGGGACTEITTKAGVVNSRVVSCPTEI